MTVADLIKKLEEMPQEMEAWIELEDYLCEVENIDARYIVAIGEAVVLS